MLPLPTFLMRSSHHDVGAGREVAGNINLNGGTAATTATDQVRAVGYVSSGHPASAETAPS